MLVGDAELEARVAAVAGGLLAAGVRSGDVVAWQLPNGPDAIALPMGVMAVTVPDSTHFAARWPSRDGR